MYNPSHFREERLDVLHALMRQHSLATVVTMGRDGLLASHLPLILDPAPAPFGTLRGHMARANPQWRDSVVEVEALAIFQGPAAYISPSWYATKAETGRVVPTYNYVVVHAHGPMRVTTDPAALLDHVRRLTEHHESANPLPWRVDDAPPEYIDNLLNAIAGIEIPVARLEGKWKVSQNRPAADRAGIAEALRAAGDPMADLIV